jgi:hypothetical protein
MKFGSDDNPWEAAKAEGIAILVRCARNREMISYTDFVRGIFSLHLEPHDFRLPDFLAEISRSEAAAGRGMLTALVVHRSGDYKPGPGFFALAGDLGRDTSDILKCWVEEVQLVFAVWES